MEVIKKNMHIDVRAYSVKGVSLSVLKFIKDTKIKM